MEGSVFVTGAAIQWLRDGLGDHRAAPRSGRSPRASPTPAASCSSPRSPGSAHRGGTRTRAARSSASPAAPRARTSSAPSSRRWRGRPRRRRRDRARRRASDRGAAGRRRRQRHGRAVPVPGRRARRHRAAARSCRRRPRSARRTSPASPPACGRRRPTPPRALERGGRVQARDARRRGRAPAREWRRGVERSRGWADASIPDAGLDRQVVDAAWTDPRPHPGRQAAPRRDPLVARVGVAARRSARRPRRRAPEPLRRRVPPIAGTRRPDRRAPRRLAPGRAEAVRRTSRSQRAASGSSATRNGRARRSSAAPDRTRARHDCVGTERHAPGARRRRERGRQGARRPRDPAATSPSAVIEHAPRGDARRAGPLPFTPRARRASAGHGERRARARAQYVGTEHILLALFDGEGVAAEVLTELDDRRGGRKATVVDLARRVPRAPRPGDAVTPSAPSTTGSDEPRHGYPQTAGSFAR